MARDDEGNSGNAAAPALYRWRFATAEFDESRFELRVAGLLVETQQKPLQLLALLLATPGELVGKERIFQVLWNNRATGDAVLANAASKLRAALGEEAARSIVTVPRQGYRFDGSVERLAVGRRQVSRLALQPGATVPGRESYQLVQLLGNSARSETWLAHHPRSGDRRVFKFALDGERLADLKREGTLLRLLRESLGERNDLVQVLDWNFETPPYWIECRHAGISLAEWASEPAPAAADAAATLGAPPTRLAAASRSERLALFLMAADVVAAAHGVGVLHKDLKPANMLVEADGGGWRLRLADFGSGRLVEPERLAALRITQLGMTVALGDASSGTPLYMAPEIGRGESPSVRSDLFALGVILYQLLAGDLKQQMAPGWEREVDDELLREDIAACTDVDPQRRLASAAELAQRLRALDQRRAERAERRATADRARATEAALVRARARRPWVAVAMLALLAGTGASLWLYAQQRSASEALARQFAVSQALNRVLREDLVGAANPARSGRADITVADALKSAAEKVDAKFGDQAPEVRGSLHAAMQLALAELSRSADAVQAGRRAVAALAQSAAADPGALRDARLRLALDLTQLSQLDEARALVQELEAAGGDLSRQPPAFRARLLFVKSWLVGGEMATAESTGFLEEARRIALAGRVEDSTRRVIEFSLADSYAMSGRLAEAEALQRALVEEQTRSFGAADPRPLYAMVGLGRTLALQRRFAEASTMLERSAEGLSAALGAGHRQALTARDQLAQIRFEEGDYAAAAAEWEKVQAGFAALMGAGSSYTLTVQTNLATALHRSGSPQRAEPLLRGALEQVRAFARDDAPQTQQIRYALADCLLDLQRGAEAAPLLSGLDAQALNMAQQEPDWTARLQFQRARAALALGDAAAARTLLQQALPGLAEEGQPGRAAARAALDAIDARHPAR